MDIREQQCSKPRATPILSTAIITRSPDKSITEIYTRMISYSSSKRNLMVTEKEGGKILGESRLGQCTSSPLANK